MSIPAGINELEGSVLLEADDYRRISNEVKSLKTMLLKLKRELQVDVRHYTDNASYYYLHVVSPLGGAGNGLGGAQVVVPILSSFILQYF